MTVRYEIERRICKFSSYCNIYIFLCGSGFYHVSSPAGMSWDCSGFCIRIYSLVIWQTGSTVFTPLSASHDWIDPDHKSTGQSSGSDGSRLFFEWESFYMGGSVIWDSGCRNACCTDSMVFLLESDHDNGQAGLSVWANHACA